MAARKVFYEHFLTKNAFFIPRKSRNPATKVYRLVGELSLKYIDKVQANFDPFHPNISSIR